MQISTFLLHTLVDVSRAGFRRHHTVVDIEDPGAEMLKWVVNPMVIVVVGDKKVEDKVKIQSRWKSRGKFDILFCLQGGQRAGRKE